MWRTETPTARTVSLGSGTALDATLLDALGELLDRRVTPLDGTVRASTAPEGGVAFTMVLPRLTCRDDRLGSSGRNQGGEWRK